MNKVTIAQIEGRVGGSEIVSSFDMRFGVRGKTKINQMEVPLGIMRAAAARGVCRGSSGVAGR